MSLANRIESALRNYGRNDAEGALHDICSSVEATAKRLYGSGGRAEYKRLITENVPVFSAMVMGVQVELLSFGFKHPELTKGKREQWSFSDVLYHAVRCSLYHQGKLPDDVAFTFDGKLALEVDRVSFPAGLILAIILLVLVSNESDGDIDEGIILGMCGGLLQLRANQLWNKREQLLALIAAANDFIEN